MTYCLLGFIAAVPSYYISFSLYFIDSLAIPYAVSLAMWITVMIVFIRDRHTRLKKDWWVFISAPMAFYRPIKLVQVMVIWSIHGFAP